MIDIQILIFYVFLELQSIWTLSALFNVYDQHDAANALKRFSIGQCKILSSNWSIKCFKSICSETLTIANISILILRLMNDMDDKNKIITNAQSVWTSKSIAA